MCWTPCSGCWPQPTASARMCDAPVLLTPAHRAADDAGCANSRASSWSAAAPCRSYQRGQVERAQVSRPGLSSATREAGSGTLWCGCPGDAHACRQHPSAPAIPHQPDQPGSTTRASDGTAVSEEGVVEIEEYDGDGVTAASPAAACDRRCSGCSQPTHLAGGPCVAATAFGCPRTASRPCEQPWPTPHCRRWHTSRCGRVPPHLRRSRSRSQRSRPRS